jgi:hypothetical protein
MILLLKKTYIIENMGLLRIGTYFAQYDKPSKWQASH